MKLWLCLWAQIDLGYTTPVFFPHHFFINSSSFFFIPLSLHVKKPLSVRQKCQTRQANIFLRPPLSPSPLPPLTSTHPRLITAAINSQSESRASPSERVRGTLRNRLTSRTLQLEASRQWLHPWLLPLIRRRSAALLHSLAPSLRRALPRSLHRSLSRYAKHWRPSESVRWRVLS